MPYLSLYRKYRPRTFAEVVGQRHVTQTLANAVRTGRIAHAYLFCGPRGTGKTSTARVLAAALNCERGPAPEPCLECESCRRIASGSALDVVEIDAASNRGIDEIRDLREKVAFAPTDARIKVYIIDEVHMLTGEAFNAFLKTLEEPPEHVVFVLATTEPHRVLPTILSRCQRFDFHRVSVGDIAANLRRVAEREGLEVDERAITLLAQAADGSVRDSLTLLDQAAAYAEGPIGPEVVTEILGGIDFGLLAEFAEVFARHDVAAALAVTDRVVAEGKDLRQLVANLIGHYRNLLVLNVDRRAAEALPLAPEALSKSLEQARALSTGEIMRILELLAECDREMRFTTQPRLVLELCVVRACGQPEKTMAVQPSRARPAPAGTARPTQPEGRETPAAQEEEPSDPLAVLKRRWPEVIAEVQRQRQTSVAAFLREAVPVGLQENALTLEFAHEFHYDQMVNKAERVQVVAQAVKKVTGLEVEVKCTLASSPGQGGGSRARRGSGESPIEQVMTLFPGSQVEE